MEDKSKELFLVSRIPPSVNHYLEYRVVRKNGKYMAMSYKPAWVLKYKKEFADYIQEEVKRQNWNHVPNKTQHFYIDTVFYFPSIDFDANNYFKVFLDTITDTKLVWLDDNVTLERVQAIYYDNVNPRMEATIKPVDYIGVFNNASQLEDFKSSCVDCTRYSRNCSILRKAIEGRIQQEIQNNVCSKYKQRATKNKKEK